MKILVGRKIGNETIIRSNYIFVGVYWCKCSRFNHLFTSINESGVGGIMEPITINRVTSVLEANGLLYKLNPNFRECMVEIEVGDHLKMAIEYRKIVGEESINNEITQNIYEPIPNKAWVLYVNSGGELKEVRCKYMNTIEEVVEEVKSSISIKKMLDELNPSSPPPNVSR